MADLIQDLVVGEHPVHDAPVVLQHPYTADQGTITTKWLVDDTAGATPEEVLAVLAATNTKFAQVAALVWAQAEATTWLVKELAEDVLAAEPLEVFLTVTVPEGGKAMVVTMARLARCPDGPAKCSVSLGKSRRGSCLP
jgi:hypothetical protein